MKLIRKFFLIILLLSFSVSILAQKQDIYIAILDSPLDYSHPDLQAAIDENLLKTSNIYDQNRVEKSWYQLNQEAKKEFEKRMGEKLYEEQVNFFAASRKNLTEVPYGQKADFIYTLIKGNLKYIYSKKFRSGLQVVAGYLHGTHVAGIAIKSLTDVKLINFPILTVQPSSKLKISDILKYDSGKYGSSLRNYYAQITEVLKKNNIQVVNMSYSASEKILLSNLMNKSTLLQRVFYKQELQKMAKVHADVFTAELKLFIESNPQSVFVTSAGNEGENVSSEIPHKINITAENLIKVAAVDDKGKIAVFSNTSPSNVDIAALGVNVTGALVGGGDLSLSGTSQAAPMVTNALAIILNLYPNLKPAEAINKLYELADTDTELQTQVKNGRRLGPLSTHNLRSPGPQVSCKSLFTGF